MASSIKSRELRMAFLLDEERLRRLTSLLKEKAHEEDISYTVEHSEGTTVIAASIDEILELPNSRRRKITSLTLDAPSRDVRESSSQQYSLFAHITLEDNRHRPVSYDIAGEYDEVVACSDRLEEHLLGLRQWYTPFIRASFIDIFLYLFLAVITFIGLLIGAQGYFSGTLALTFEVRYLAAYMLGFVVIFLIVGSGVLQPLLKRLYPTGTFAIGQGIERHKRLNTIRYTIFTGVILAGLVGLAVNYIS
jgi:hypothetical protein